MVNADACRIPRANVMSPRTVAEVSDCHRQHRLRIGVHNSVRVSAPLRSAPTHMRRTRLYDGGVVCNGPRPRPQPSEMTFVSVNSSRVLTTGAARPNNINLYIKQHACVRAWRAGDGSLERPLIIVCNAIRQQLMNLQWCTTLHVILADTTVADTIW